MDLLNEMAVMLMQTMNVEFVSTVVLPMLSGYLN